MEVSDERAAKLSSISKAFAGVQANDKVDLSILEGEIHVLLGENGAGKTTLMTAYTGFMRPTAARSAGKAKKFGLRASKTPSTWASAWYINISCWYTTSP